MLILASLLNLINLIFYFIMILILLIYYDIIISVHDCVSRPTVFDEFIELKNVFIHLHKIIIIHQVLDRI